MGFWVGVERGLDALYERDQAEKARKREDELLKEDRRRWEANYQLKLVDTIGTVSRRRATTDGGKPAGGDAVTRDMVLKEAATLGVEEAAFLDDLDKYGNKAVYDAMQNYRGYVKDRSNDPNLLSSSDFMGNTVYALTEEGYTFDPARTLREAGVDLSSLEGSQFEDLTKPREVGPSYSPSAPFFEPTPSVDDLDKNRKEQLRRSMNTVVLPLRQELKRKVAQGSASEEEIERLRQIDSIVDGEGDLEVKFYELSGTLGGSFSDVDILSQAQRRRVWEAAQGVGSSPAPLFKVFEPREKEVPESGSTFGETVGSLTGIPLELGRPTETKVFPPRQIGNTLVFDSNESLKAYDEEIPEGVSTMVGAEVVDREAILEESEPKAGFSSFEEAKGAILDNPKKYKVGQEIFVGGVSYTLTKEGKFERTLSNVMGDISSSTNSTKDYYSGLGDLVKDKLINEANIIWPTNEEELEWFLDDVNEAVEDFGLNIPQEVLDRVVDEASRDALDPKPGGPVEVTEEELVRNLDRAERAYQWDWSHGRKGSPTKLARLEKAKKALEEFRNKSDPQG